MKTEDQIKEKIQGYKNHLPEVTGLIDRVKLQAKIQMLEWVLEL